MAILQATYSFTNFIATITGPGGSFTISGPDTAAAEEGFTVSMSEETNTQSIGADGSVMNSLHASKAGLCGARLQKTSPINLLLANMYNLQRTSSALWGLNVITARDIARGDAYTLSGCAFVRFPANAYGKVGNMIDWEWAVSILDPFLGPGFLTL
jgi:hypothetical protein